MYEATCYMKKRLQQKTCGTTEHYVHYLHWLQFGIGVRVGLQVGCELVYKSCTYEIELHRSQVI